MSYEHMCDDAEKTQVFGVDSAAVKLAARSHRPGDAHDAASEHTVVLGEEPVMLLAWLVVVDGPGQIGHVHQLASRTRIGRAGESDLVLPDPSVSALHAELEVVTEAGRVQYQLRDLGSQNKTRVNGRESVAHDLQDGDRVRLGRTTLVFRVLRRPGSDGGP